MSVFKIGAIVKHSAYPGIVWEIIGLGKSESTPSYHCKAIASTHPGYLVGWEFNALYAHCLTLAERPLTVVTTGITACRDAHRKGFRVQCLQALGEYRDLISPQWNGDTDSYRIHPDDVPRYMAWYNGQHVAPVSPPQPVSTARPHAELIKAWADGAEIEYWHSVAGTWLPCPRPSFLEKERYRIKPQPAAKPKISRAVFEKAKSRSRRKYTLRLAKLRQQQAQINLQVSALQLAYEAKNSRQAVFAKEHVE